MSVSSWPARWLVLAAFAAGFAGFVCIPLVAVAALVRGLAALAGYFALLIGVHTRKAAPTALAGFAALTARFGMLLLGAAALIALVLVALAAGFGVLLRTAALRVFSVFCHG